MEIDTFVIRRAVDSDAYAVADVWLRSYTTALRGVHRAHSDQEVYAWFRDTIVPTHETWVATVEDSVVGMMVLSGGDLDQLYLDPPWRGNGIGDRLVDLAKQRCPAGLALWTFQINAPAQRFYERHGFVAVERTDGRGNEEHVPDVRFVWRPAN